MAHPFLKELVGRYEYVNESENSDKFWSCDYDRSSKAYTTSWGRNGRPPQGMKEGLSTEEAYKKITEKISKGYQKVSHSLGITEIPSPPRRRAARTVKPKPKRKQKPKSKGPDFLTELRRLK